MNYNALDYMDFVIEFEEEMSKGDCEKNAYDIAQELSPSYGIPWDTLHDCIDSKEGNDYQHVMAQDTPSDHEYVVMYNKYLIKPFSISITIYLLSCCWWSHFYLLFLVVCKNCSNFSFLSTI